MAKKRTRAQKIKAQSNPNTISYSYGKTSFETTADKTVKGYFENENSTQTGSKIIKNNPINTGNMLNLKLIKRDLIKSLSVASFILCLEVVLYLLWYK